MLKVFHILIACFLLFFASCSSSLNSDGLQYEGVDFSDGSDDSNGNRSMAGNGEDKGTGNSAEDEIDEKDTGEVAESILASGPSSSDTVTIQTQFDMQQMQDIYQGIVTRSDIIVDSSLSYGDASVAHVAKTKSLSMVYGPSGFGVGDSPKPDWGSAGGDSFLLDLEEEDYASEDVICVSESFGVMFYAWEHYDGENIYSEKVDSDGSARIEISREMPVTLLVGFEMLLSLTCDPSDVSLAIVIVGALFFEYDIVDPEFRKEVNFVNSFMAKTGEDYEDVIDLGASAPGADIPDWLKDTKLAKMLRLFWVPEESGILKEEEPQFVPDENNPVYTMYDFPLCVFGYSTGLFDYIESKGWAPQGLPVAADREGGIGAGTTMGSGEVPDKDGKLGILEQLLGISYWECSESGTYEMLK